MLERFKRTLGFVVRQPKDAAIIGLSLICIFLNWKIGSERREAERSREIAGDLPADTKQIVTIYRDRVITKWRDGPQRVIYKERYLPPEGTVTLVTKKDSETPEVAVKDRGWTLRPGGGVLWSERLLPCADVKFAYWRRYGLTASLTPNFGGLGATRHLDDFLPFRNLEFQIVTGPSWEGRLRLSLGIRTNF